MPLKCRFDGLGLPALCDCHKLKWWACDGAHVASKRGRGGGFTHKLL